MTAPRSTIWAARGRRYGAVALIVLLWVGLTAPRIAWPCHVGHEAYITSLYGTFAHNHLKLGLAVTHGTNVMALDYSGKPMGYYSWSPLASWLIAAPLAAGLPLQPAVKLVTFLFFLWFLVAFWAFARQVWGERVATVALAVLVVLPVNIRYVFFAPCSLGPTFTALTLIASGRLGDRRGRFGAALCGVISGLLFWFDWLLLLPALAGAARRGAGRAAGVVAAWTLGVPVAVMAAALLAGGGGWREQVRHLLERLGGGRMSSGDVPVSYAVLLHRLGAWTLHSPYLFGPVASGVAVATMLWVLSCRLRRDRTPVPGDGWLWGLVAYGVPCTLLFRNMASDHDFFYQLYAPAVALCAGLAATRVADWIGVAQASKPASGGDAIGVAQASKPASGDGLGGRRLGSLRYPRRWALPLAALVLLAGVVATGTWPARSEYRPTPFDYWQRDLAATLGRIVGPDTVIFASPHVALDPGTEPLDLAHRELSVPTPWVFCLTGKTGYVCRDAAETRALIGQLPGPHEIVLVEREDQLAPLPAGAEVYRFGWYTVARFRPDPVAGAGGAGAGRGK